jgi:hypothetical protein
LVYAVTTTAQLIIQVQKPTTFVIHAAAANTANVNISGTDTSVASEFDELMAGQDLCFTNYVGSIWAVAASGTQNIYIPFRQEQSALVSKNP